MDLIFKPIIQKCKWRSGIIRLTSKSSENSDNIDCPKTEQNFSLPLCLEYTKDGLIPHLTWDLLKYIPDKNVPALVSLGSVYNLLPVLRSCDSSFSEFISSDFNRSIFLTIQDVLVNRRQGFNSPTFTPIWTESGRQNIYPIDLIECVKSLKPDFYHLLADGETPKNCSNKRVDKSVENTIKLAENSFGIKDFDWTIKPIFGVIEGGWNIEKRLTSIEKTKSLPVDGYIVDGLLSTDLLDDSNGLELKLLISKICSNLPDDKPRALFGPLKPERVIDVISSGIDIIDSSYCAYLTNNETALLVDINCDNITNITSNLIRLSDDNLKEDFKVIDHDCNCYTCTKGFTRAYLNHLMKTKELLGPILINLHNLFVYYNFINQIHSYFNSLQQSDSRI
ncbi:queuine tRNA-ribosyltransferase accessory subunit 2-like [Panonychus citri]|uniref:queuine tRNA-ribosyltransferase accessory subunit 2-like n=1 Tax=Panonychus citri TaxID=50023 RepID=UPI0023070472|nr:queuine tRNA-ribosyltransferase accessory subunit 2-like [Panonychus citri]